MKYLILVIILCVVPIHSFASAEIAVSYVEPMKYNDIESTDRSRARSIKEFESVMNAYFAAEGIQFLKENHRLQLDIIDVDRAGTFRFDLFPSHRGVRVVKDTAVVRIKVIFTLFDSQKNSIRSGEHNIREFYNVNSARYRKSSHSELFFEKQLLSNWLSKLYD